MSPTRLDSGYFPALTCLLGGRRGRFHAVAAAYPIHLFASVPHPYAPPQSPSLAGTSLVPWASRAFFHSVFMPAPFFLSLFVLLGSVPSSFILHPRKPCPSARPCCPLSRHTGWPHSRAILPIAPTCWPLRTQHLCTSYPPHAGTHAAGSAMAPCHSSSCPGHDFSLSVQLPPLRPPPAPPYLSAS